MFPTNEEYEHCKHKKRDLLQYNQVHDIAYNIHTFIVNI